MTVAHISALCQASCVHRGLVDWLLTFVAGAVGVAFLGLALGNAMDGEYAWAAVATAIALPGCGRPTK